jgi:hypothetical protein
MYKKMDRFFIYTTAEGSGNVGDSSAFFPTAVSVVEYLLENDSPKVGTHFTFTDSNKR